jgi:hypothetical protein
VNYRRVKPSPDEEETRIVHIHSRNEEETRIVHIHSANEEEKTPDEEEATR